MNHDPVTDRLEALDAMQAPSPSAEARARMFAGVSRRAKARRRARVIAVSAAAVAGVALAVWIGRTENPFGLGGSSPSANGAGGDSWSGDDDPADVVRLAPEETYTLATATFVARSAAQIYPSRNGVRLDQGTLAIYGAADVQGGSCQASVDGRCEVTRFEHSLRFVVEAGRVEIHSPPPTCTIVDLDDPAAEAREQMDGTEGSARARRPRPFDPIELAQQTAAYREALALAGHDDPRALAALRAMQTRWRRGPLSPEVDFQIVRVLVHMDRDADARDAARAFLRRHPRSTRAPEMQRLVDSEGDGR